MYIMYKVILRLFLNYKFLNYWTPDMNILNVFHFYWSCRYFILKNITSF